jgi:hypothetical protein
MCQAFFIKSKIAGGISTILPATELDYGYAEYYHKKITEKELIEGTDCDLRCTTLRYSATRIIEDIADIFDKRIVVEQEDPNT